MAPASSLSFEEVAHVVEELLEHYGRFHDEVDCQEMKQSLTKMERCEGRVELSRFYRASLEGKWQFSESAAWQDHLLFTLRVLHCRIIKLYKPKLSFSIFFNLFPLIYEDISCLLFDVHFKWRGGLPREPGRPRRLQRGGDELCAGRLKLHQHLEVLRPVLRGPL